MWILIADGEHARIVVPDDKGVFRTEWAVDSAMAHRRSAELGSAEPGRSYESAKTARHAIAPKHDLHAQEKRLFLRCLAQQVDHKLAEGQFDELGVVVPVHSMHEFLSALGELTLRKVTHTLGKDLTQVTRS